MNQTRDIRSLRDYELHFAKFNRRVLNISDVSKDMIGIIEDNDGVLYFIPVTYYGNKIYDKLFDKFYKWE